MPLFVSFGSRAGNAGRSLEKKREDDRDKNGITNKTKKGYLTTVRIMIRGPDQINSGRCTVLRPLEDLLSSPISSSLVPAENPKTITKERSSTYADGCFVDYNRPIETQHRTKTRMHSIVMDILVLRGPLLGRGTSSCRTSAPSGGCRNICNRYMQNSSRWRRWKACPLGSSALIRIELSMPIATAIDGDRELQ